MSTGNGVPGTLVCVSPENEGTERRIGMTGTMLALVKERPERGATLTKVNIPSIAEDEVLVKIDYASICGTDVHIYVWNEWAQNRIKTPHIMGHEFAGHVVETGRSVRGFKEGDFVSSETHITAGTAISAIQATVRSAR